MPNSTPSARSPFNTFALGLVLAGIPCHGASVGQEHHAQFDPIGTLSL
ncbi:hypothetical protein [Sodalis sp. RH19]